MRSSSSKMSWFEITIHFYSWKINSLSWWYITKLAQVVVQSRLCRYSFYQTNCCQSCSFSNKWLTHQSWFQCCWAVFSQGGEGAGSGGAYPGGRRCIGAVQGCPMELWTRLVGVMEIVATGEQEEAGRALLGSLLHRCRIIDKRHWQIFTITTHVLTNDHRSAGQSACS